MHDAVSEWIISLKYEKSCHIKAKTFFILKHCIATNSPMTNFPGLPVPRTYQLKSKSSERTHRGSRSTHTPSTRAQARISHYEEFKTGMQCSFAADRGDCMSSATKKKLKDKARARAREGSPLGESPRILPRRASQAALVRT